VLATCSLWFLARGFFYLDDGGDTFLRNVDLHKIYTALHPRDGILKIRNFVFWNATPCIAVKVNHYFERSISPPFSVFEE
jgi:hypothetical protein